MFKTGLQLVKNKMKKKKIVKNPVKRRPKN